VDATRPRSPLRGFAEPHAARSPTVVRKSAPSLVAYATLRGLKQRVLRPYGL